MIVSKEDFEKFNAKHDLVSTMASGMSGNPPFYYTYLKRGNWSSEEPSSVHSISKERVHSYSVYEK